MFRPPESTPRAKANGDACSLMSAIRMVQRPEEFACLKGKVSACPMARLRYVNWRHAQAHTLRRAPEEKRFPMTG
jgi:hypothetical protein